MVECGLEVNNFSFVWVETSFKYFFNLIQLLPIKIFNNNVEIFLKCLIFILLIKKLLYNYISVIGCSWVSKTDVFI